ncbi:MAG: DUF4138 domain-containing protein [Bacteroidota bacterium]
MRNFWIYIAIIILACPTCTAQVDTIQVSRNYKTLLVFPSPYDFAVNGKDLNFIESFPQGSSSEVARHMVMLIYNDVAPDTKDYTNYTVYTQDGLAYDFILELVDIPDKKRWTINVSMADNKDEFITNSIGLESQRKTVTGISEEPVIVDSPKHRFGQDRENVLSGQNDEGNETDLPITLDLYKRDKKEYMRRRCYYNQFNKPKIMRFYGRSGDVFLWLQGIYYDNNELYFQFRIHNKESIDYDLNFLRFSIGTNYRNTSSNQKLDHSPIYQYKVPKRIKGHSENHFIVVFDKFTLDRKKVLLVDMDEERGNRNLSLSIDHNLINKPLNF